MADRRLGRQHFLTKEESRQAKKRAGSRVEEREHLRLEIKARDILQRMGATVDTLIMGYEDVETQVGDTIQQPLTRDRIFALKAASDIDKTLLDRVLPVLRSVDVQPEEEFDDPMKLTDNDLRRQLSNFMGLGLELLDREVSASIPSFLGEESETLQ